MLLLLDLNKHLNDLLHPPYTINHLIDAKIGCTQKEIIFCIEKSVEVNAL